jgi:hypothetical protein
MTIEQYLFHLHATRLMLMAGCAGQGDSRGLQLRMQWKSVDVCCSPPNHRPYYRYIGDGEFVCDVCSSKVA